jgi:hypothetical protein
MAVFADTTKRGNRRTHRKATTVWQGKQMNHILVVLVSVEAQCVFKLAVIAFFQANRDYYFAEVL